VVATRGAKSRADALRFRLVEILDPGISVDLDLSPAELDELLADGDDTYRTVGTGLRGSLELTKSEEMVFVRGGFEVTLGFACRRCLAEGRRTHTIELDWTFLPAEKYRSEVPEEEEVELTEEDLDVSFFEGEIIELRDVLREAILLEVDPYPACEPECAPADAPAVGTARDDAASVDPRWLPLLDIKKKNRS
jgi:uncharacterized protein